MVQIPKNFRNPLVPKVLGGSEKFGRCKNGTDILYLHAMFSGDLQRWVSWEAENFGVFCRFVCHAYSGPYIEHRTEVGSL